MRQDLLALLVFAIAAAATGCGSESGSASGAAPIEKLSYAENGHPLVTPTENASVFVLESELLRLVNDLRASEGLDALVHWDVVAAVARAHSEHMCVHRFINHVSPEGTTPGERMSMAGVVGSRVGENLAAGYAAPQDVLDSWLTSPGHRENILRKEFTHGGAGYAADPAPTSAFPYIHYWTLNFCSP